MTTEGVAGVEETKLIGLAEAAVSPSFCKTTENEGIDPSGIFAFQSSAGQVSNSKEDVLGF